MNKKTAPLVILFLWVGICRMSAQMETLSNGSDSRPYPTIQFDESHGSLQLAWTTTFSNLPIQPIGRSCPPTIKYEIRRVGNYCFLIKQTSRRPLSFASESEAKKGKPRYSLSVPTTFNIKKLNRPKLHDPYAEEKVTAFDLFMNVLFESIFFPDNNNYFRYGRSTIDN